MYQLLKQNQKIEKKVITSIISNKNINNLINGIERKIKKNEQVFWILPNIGNNDEFQENQNETVLSRFNYLKNIFKDNVSLIHGKMSDENNNKKYAGISEWKKNDSNIYHNG